MQFLKDSNLSAFLTKLRREFFKNRRTIFDPVARTGNQQRGSYTVNRVGQRRNTVTYIITLF